MVVVQSGVICLSLLVASKHKTIFLSIQSVTKHFGQNSKIAQVYKIIEPPRPSAMSFGQKSAQNVAC